MTVRVTSAALSSLVRECFERLRLPRDDAEAVAEALVDANLRGHDSHGFARVPVYMRRVAAGLAGGTEGMRELARAGALCRLDAGSALGPAAAAKATAIAAEIAREHGIGLVAVGNSSHFGAAGFYARRASERGLLAIVATNGPANMAPHGAAEPFLGTNAIALSVPLGSRGEFVLDMSSSVAARGKIIRARELGEAIEPGLAIDPQGAETTDPAAALAGAVLPLGGPKGTGLALAISLFVGVLAGAGFDDEVVHMHGEVQRPQNLGHILLLIDPWRLADPGETTERLEALVDRLHSLRRAPGFDRLLFAGERGALEREARLEAGIPLEAEELEALARTCRELELPDLAERARALAAPSAGP